MKKSITLLLLLMLLPIVASAHDFYVEGIYYRITDTNEVAVSYAGPTYNQYANEYSGEVVIPDSVTYNGITYSITSIDDKTFYSCKELTSVVIGNSVKTIGSYAFYTCYKLTNVVFGNSLTTIGDHAFIYCNGLTTIDIPNSVTVIRYLSFSNCTGLTNVNLGSSVTIIEDRVFDRCSSLTSIDIPNSVTTIGWAAFRDCYKLDTITIGNSVTSIQDYAFDYCGIKKLTWNAVNCTTNGGMPTSDIEHVTIGSEVESLPRCFALNSKIVEVIIPSSVISIGNKAFYGCSDLSCTDIGNSVEIIGDSAFMNCSHLTNIVIPNSTTTIGSSAFNGCYGLLGEIYIPNLVTAIGDRTFYGCSNLSSIVLGQSITSIGVNAFTYCSGLTSINIPNSVTTIGYGAFYNCSNLTNANFGNSVTEIGSNAFLGCSSLTSVSITDVASWVSINFNGADSNPLSYAHHLYMNGSEVTDLIIPSSVTTISNIAFYGCYGLTSIDIPNSVIEIGSDAFMNCTGLTSVSITDVASWVSINFNGADSNPLSYAHHLYMNGSEVTDLIIPSSVTTISSYALCGCSGLMSIVIPNSLRTINKYAFLRCTGLTKVKIPNSVLTIDNGAFKDCRGLLNIEIPNSVSTIGDAAFSGCSGLKSVNIPTSITSISNSMFYNCTGLTNINIPNSVATIGNSAFYGCKGLTSIEIPNSVTSIGGYAFYGCTGLKNLFIGTSITSIGDQAFYSCYNISTLMITGEGEWQGVNIPLSTSPKLYIDSHVTGLSGAKAPHSDIFCFATTPPTCDNNSLKNYSGTLHVPASSLAAYFTAEYWSNFDNIVGDAIEPNITISQDSVEMELGAQFSLTANVTPSNASPNSITWISTNVNIATVNNYGKVQSVGAGECDIIAQCLNKKAICHVLVKDTTVTITLSQHEAMLLPNHMIYITLIPNPIVPELSVISSDPSVAAARVVNNTVQVVGIKEGTTTITVGSVDGTAIPATCIVTVYTEPGDLNCDGFVNISDVTSLIDYLLSGDDSQISTKNANVNGDESINISDVTELIDYLLNGGFWPWEYETFNANGVKFTMVRVKGGTFMMGATSEQGNDALENEYPIHQVTLSDYMIGQTEVTQQLWVAVMGSNPSRFGGHMDRPVENVSWEQCQSFIRKLNQLTGMTFRLPTEAEWEYAARGGNRSSGYKYSGSNDFDEVAWCDVSGSDWLNPKYGTHTAASLKPNELRLYDMSGNVFEWCQDKYGTYSAEDQINPTGAESGAGVWRGGAWDASASRSRVSSRQSNFASFYVGLRLAL